MDEKIKTDLYRKPNTKCQYLLPDSAHPRHCYPGIAKSLAHRVVRICSTKEDREIRLAETKDLLLGRGYKRGMLNDVMSAACNMDRDQALEKVVRGQEEDRVRFVTTYEPKLPSIPKKNWKTMTDRDRRLSIYKATSVQQQERENPDKSKTECYAKCADKSCYWC